MDLSLFIVTSAALLDSLNPCAISVLLLTIGFLVNLGKERVQISRIGFIYIGAIYLTYLLIGLGILQALTFFGVPHFLARLGAILLFMTGLINFLGVIISDFPIKLKIPSSAHPIIAHFISKASYVSAFILGVLVGLFEFPCTGGPYLTILSLLHDKATFASGFLYLLYYNVIFVSPLVVILVTGSSKKIIIKWNEFRKNRSYCGRKR